MTRALPLLAIVCAIAVPHPIFAQTLGTVTFDTVRVAYFSPQRAFSGSTEGRAVIARLTALQTEKSRPLEDKRLLVQAERQAFEQTAPQLSAAARDQRDKALQKSELDVQRLFQDLQSELLGLQRDAETAFLAKLKPIVAQVVKDKGLNVLFNEDSGMIAMADPSLDLTDEIVKRLDRPSTANP
jgi:outer membrane protein